MFKLLKAWSVSPETFFSSDRNMKPRLSLYYKFTDCAACTRPSELVWLAGALSQQQTGSPCVLLTLVSCVETIKLQTVACHLWYGLFTCWWEALLFIYFKCHPVLTRLCMKLVVLYTKATASSLCECHIKGAIQLLSNVLSRGWDIPS